MHLSNLGLIYVIGTYPLLTTTFIDREIKRLRDWGVDLQVVAMRRPPADTPFSEEQRALMAGVTYLLPPAWLALILSHLFFGMTRPRKYFGTLVYLLTRPSLNGRTRLKTLFHFGEGVYAAFLVRKRSFKEFHAHFLDRAATIALVAGRLLDKSYSLSIHAGADIFVEPVLLSEKLREARQAATCTEYNKTHLQKLIGQDLVSKISHIPHGLELSKYSGSRQKSNNNPLILSVGQLADRKGFAQLIQSCRRLKDRGYHVNCQIVGRGPQLEQLLDLIKRLSLEESVSLCGALPHDEVIKKYQQAAMFVLPCIQTETGDLDGIPNVLAEAMASGVPVISTTISAIPELIEDQKNGLLVPPKDIEALAGAMGSLLDRPELGIELGENGRLSIIKTFNAENNVKQFATTLWPEYFQTSHAEEQI